MCIAITKPADTKPDWEAYQQGFTRNPDGWGFAVPHDGRVLIRKDVTSFDKFREAFELHAHLPALVHFRIKTHGLVNKRNCHPFRLTDSLAMIHNGMLDLECSLRNDKSDTWHFCKQVLRPMADADPRFAWNIGSSFLGEQFINSNKVAFLDADGNFKIWNREAGVDAADGHWYSNCSYIKPKPLVFGSELKSKSKPKSTPTHWGHYGSVSTYSDRKYDAVDSWDDAPEPWELDEGSYRDDPIYQQFGFVDPEQYESIQGCLAAGLPMDLISAMYNHDPGLVETVAWYHDV